VVAHLLWGDSVRIEDAEVAINGRIKAKARGRNGFVKWDDLNDESLLEVYFIDVGQGDGILIKTPSNEHIMVDGGYKRTAQQSGKNAADFVDWKFFRDYGMDTIELDAMISSHNDSDHYGGLWDLINPKEEKELSIKTANVNVKKYYHAGVAWLKDAAGKRGLGPVINNKLTLLQYVRQNRQSIK
jgi:glyoxylase-like metal-dependent hydrolase (beta-lactamase superfamily II)